MKTGLFTFDPQAGVVPPGSISNSELANMDPRTVKVNATNAATSPQDLQGTTPYDVLHVNAAGTGLEFGPPTSGAYVLKAGDTMTGALTVNQNTDLTPPGGTASLHLIQADGVQNSITIDAYATSANLQFRTANGTKAAPTNVVVSGLLGNVSARAYGATAFAATNRGSYQIRASEDWTDTAQGAELWLLTVPNGTATNTQRWRVANDGCITYHPATNTGTSTINAVDYFDTGVNINTIYGSLALANTWTQTQTVNLNATALPAPGITGVVLHMGNADAASTRILLDSFTGTPNITGRVAGGTNAAPTALVANVVMLNLTAFGHDGAAHTLNRASLSFLTAENWSVGANGTRILLQSTANGTTALTARWGVENDGSFVYSGGALTGVSTINAEDYFDNGVNINTIYGSLALANTWTQAQTINVNATFGLEVRRVDNGSLGPGIKLRHETSSPAINDYAGFMNIYGTNDAGVEVLAGYFQVLVLDPAAATFGAEMRVGGAHATAADSTYLRVKNGLLLQDGGVTTTGGWQGGSTINAKGYYSNGNLFADSSGLIRTRQYTVATLPAAGTAGRKAAVTDALAPAYGVAVAGGGAINIPVYDNGVAWVTV